MTSHTPGPWHLCHHLRSVEDDKACHCGYRGVIFGPEHGIAYAICQPGHDPDVKGEEGLSPSRYPREVEIANAYLIAAAPDLLAACEAALADCEQDDWGGSPLAEQLRAAIKKATDPIIERIPEIVIPRPKPKESRPFPRKCGKCFEDAVILKSHRYHAAVKCGSVVERFVVPDLVVPTCERCGEMFFDIKADDQITEALKQHLAQKGEPS